MITTTTPAVEMHAITDYRRIDVLQALPMELALEAQQLVAISLEGSVG